MGRVFKREDRDSWWIDYVDGKGERRREKGSRDKSVALRMLAAAELKADRQRAGELPADLTDSLAVIRDRYRQHMQHVGRKENTLEVFDRSWRNLIEENGWKTVQHLRLETLEEWAHRRHSFNGEAGTRAQTVNLYVTIIHGMLDWAEKTGLIVRNPFKAWTRLPDDSPRYRRDLKREEIDRILAAAADSPEWHLRFLVYFNTALRSSAGSVLRWCWINWERREIVLPAKDNKSKKDHIIPMNQSLHASLMRFRAAEPMRADGCVFKPLTTRHILRTLKEYCAKAGVDVDGVCTHSTRHTVATMIYNGTGKDLKAAQELLGHATIATTEKYLHTDEETKRRGVDALDFGTNAAPAKPKSSATA